MRILVTGANGFVGLHLVRELSSIGHQCKCLLRDPSKTGNLAKYPGVTFHIGDLTQNDSLVGIEKDIECVVHLAAHGHVSAISKEAYDTFTDTNVNGTHNLIKQCSLNSGIRLFIHFSSTAAMGLVKEKIVTEKSVLAPATPYQKSKRESELAALSYWFSKKFPVCIFRPCMIFGPGGEGEFLKMCKLIVRGYFPRIGIGRNLTPMVYVDDVVQAVINGLEKARPGETYLIASNESYELTLIREIILKKMKIRRPYPYIPAWAAMLGAFLLEGYARVSRTTPFVTVRNIRSTAYDRVFDITKITEEIGFRQKLSVEESIAKTLDWYLGNNLL